MKFHQDRHKSVLIESFSYLLEYSNKHFTLSKWVIRSEKDIFFQIERMMLIIMLVTLVALFTLHLMPTWLMIGVSVILAQRIIEFLIVYSRNFIFGRGRIFTDFRDPLQRGEWLIMMFSINVVQITLIFSIWYRSLSLYAPSSFSQNLSVLDAFYFSVVTFLTVGFGDIIPVSSPAKALVLLQSALTFYTFVIVINGLISIHFIKK